VVYAADPKDDWTLPETWKKANPNYNVTVPHDYLERECKRAQTVPAYQNTFKRLHLNLWTAQATRWMDMGLWDANGGATDLRLLRRRPCYGGLDLASSNDLAAFALVFPPLEPGGPYDILCRFFLPEDDLVERGKRDGVPYMLWAERGFIKLNPGSVIRQSFIKAEIEKLGLQFAIQEIAYDRWGAIFMADDLEESGFTLFQFGQGFAAYASPVREFGRLLGERRLRTRGHPVLRWMADNVMMDQDPSGNLRPNKAKSQQKIDGITATVMGLDRALRHDHNAPSTLGDDRGVAQAQGVAPVKPEQLKGWVL
jgi:phage terminase large subunit-like protein